MNDNVNVFQFLDQAGIQIEEIIRPASIWLSLYATICVGVYGAILLMTVNKNKIEIIYKYLFIPIIIIIVLINFYPLLDYVNIFFLGLASDLGLKPPNFSDFGMYMKNIYEASGINGDISIGSQIFFGFLAGIAFIGRGVAMLVTLFYGKLIYLLGYIAFAISVIPIYRKQFIKVINLMLRVGFYFIIIAVLDIFIISSLNNKKDVNPIIGYYLNVESYNLVDSKKENIKYYFDVKKEMNQMFFSKSQNFNTVNKEKNLSQVYNILKGKTNKKDYFSDDAIQQRLKYINLIKDDLKKQNKEVDLIIQEIKRFDLMDQNEIKLEKTKIGSSFLIQILLFISYFFIPKLTSIVFPKSLIGNGVAVANTLMTNVVTKVGQGTLGIDSKRVKSLWNKINPIKNLKK